MSSVWEKKKTGTGHSGPGAILSESTAAELGADSIICDNAVLERGKQPPGEHFHAFSLLSGFRNAGRGEPWA